MLDSLLKLYPDDSFLLMGAGEVELFAGLHRQSEEYYRKAMAVLPEETPPTTQIAWSLLKKGEEREANIFLRKSLEITDRALAAGSENYDHMIDRARVFSLQGDTTQALSWLQRAVDAGWRLDRLIELDPQLETIRKTDWFVRLLSGLRSRAGEVRGRLKAQIPPNEQASLPPDRAALIAKKHCWGIFLFKHQSAPATRMSHGNQESSRPWAIL
jgi:tetratricopeptide (TPR) repeat protein